ncbi:MAG: amidohydrolase family protein [Chloroflexi bacterium]|nr:amidohydrolase family protein [Chloroflexota bacterium]
MTHDLCGGHYVTGDPIEVQMEGDRISRVVELMGAGAESARSFWLVPALVDIQVNGFAGRDFNVPEVTVEHVRDVTRALWKAGVAYYCPTITTGSPEWMIHSLRTVAAACQRDPATRRAVLGIHLEGPYISPEDGPRGAHPVSAVRPPDYREFQAMQEAAGGRIRIVTLAPELPGAIPFIERLTAEGVVIGLGHLSADGEQVSAAVAAGARLSTHLGNGSHAQLPRHPNYLWDQLACDELWASIIPDGHHLPPAVVKTILRAKGVDRIILVSDAMFAAGTPPGEYLFMDQRVVLTPAGRVQLAGTPYLAGSALHLVEGLGNVVAFAGVSLEDAVRMATHNPRRLLGIPTEEHDLSPGSPADLLLLSGDPAAGSLSLAFTVVGGEVVYVASGG